jgi:hypothetical protein
VKKVDLAKLKVLFSLLFPVDPHRAKSKLTLEFVATQVMEADKVVTSIFAWKVSQTQLQVGTAG